MTYTAHRCRTTPKTRARFTDDDTPRGHVHECDAACTVTKCGKPIPTNGSWYMDEGRKVTCPRSEGK
jgi:hypothetical protein